jgi:hypothetical protein
MRFLLTRLVGLAYSTCVKIHTDVDKVNPSPIKTDDKSFTFNAIIRCYDDSKAFTFVLAGCRVMNECVTPPSYRFKGSYTGVVAVNELVARALYDHLVDVCEIQKTKLSPNFEYAMAPFLLTDLRSLQLIPTIRAGYETKKAANLKETKEDDQ